MVIGANLQPLRFLGMINIPIISASGEAVHCDFPVQERGLTLLGVGAMRKLKITVPFGTVKEEIKQPEPISPSTYNYEIEHRSAKIIQHADFLSHYSAMRPSSKTSDTLLMQPLAVSREDLQRELRKSLGSIIKSLRSRWQYKARRKLPEYFKQQEDSLLCLNDRMIVPLTLRKPTLDDLHSSHLGIAKEKLLDRQMAWWPELNTDFVNTGKNCTQC